MNTISEPARETPIVAEADVVVAGGGPGGITAAVAAARCGAKVILIERYGFLGGMATAGMIGPILSHRAHNAPVAIIGGIPREICDRLASMGGAVPWEAALKDWGVRFSPEIFKVMADRIVLEAGVRIMFHSYIADAVVENGRIKALIIENKSGRQAVAGRFFVDATGDADAAFRAGAKTTHGRPFDGRGESMGSMFRIGGVKPCPKEAHDAVRRKIEEARASDYLHTYNPSFFQPSATVRSDESTPNLTRFGGSAVDAETLTQAEIFVREQSWRTFTFYKENVPGMEDSFLAALPTNVGVRETRQIVGPYALTGDDVLAGRKFDDSIARASWWIDIHCPMGYSHPGHLCNSKCAMKQPCAFKDAGLHLKIEKMHPPEGDWYGVPYRSLLSVSFPNLLSSGRCISATHEGMAGTRVMGTCLAIGQAAGTAAAMAADKGIEAPQLPANDLRRKLIENGALV
ncbi:MAG TPA: FAD-dependent oxidoreductase [Candidatus Brocadiia bacterium]|nr:FAD-dependent oxidoreductase [Candidatus Brocadiia bacterium]